MDLTGSGGVRPRKRKPRSTQSNLSTTQCLPNLGFMPDHGKLLYEGKAKRIFATANPDQVLVEFKNDATAFNAQKKAQLADKGRLNCQISARLFELLEAAGIPSHYIGLVGETWMKVKRVEIIPLEVVLRNIATGSLCRQTPIVEGTTISPALLDLYYKDDALADPLLTEARVRLIGVADASQLLAIEQLARRVNAVLVPFFEGIGLQLVDFKLELGITPRVNCCWLMKSAQTPAGSGPQQLGCQDRSGQGSFS